MVAMHKRDQLLLPFFPPLLLAVSRLGDLAGAEAGPCWRTGELLPAGLY